MIATPSDYTPEPLEDFEPARKALHNAVSSRKTFQPLITENLDAEFNKAVALKTNPDLLSKNLFASSGPVRKHPGMKRSANSFSIDRVFDVPHNPFRSRLAIETPQNLVELYQRFRYYVQREPLVGTAVELHSEFPLSQFQLVHPDPNLAQDFNDMAEQLDLFDFLLDMSLEFYIIGEAFPMGIFDDPKNPQVWEKFILLNPINMEIASSPMTDGRGSNVYRLRIDKVIRDIVTNGPTHLLTGKLYNRIPQDVIDSIKSGNGTMELPETQVSHFKRKSNYFRVRGESLLYRIIHLLNYRDKARDAQYSIMDRNATPREVWKVGESDNIATEDELAGFSAMLAQSYMDPNQAIVWHHALQVEILSGSEKLMPLRQELDGIESEMLTGLMLNKGFLDSSYGAYANMSVALDVLIARYLSYRTRIEKWIKNSVFAPICRLQGIYKPTQAELSHRIRIKNQNKQPYVPEIHWDKQELRDNASKVNLLMSLREKLGRPNMPAIPKDIIYQAMNLNPATMKKMLLKEKKDDEISGGTNVSLGGGGPGIAGGLGNMSVSPDNLGAPIGGGGEAPGGTSGTELNIAPSELPEFNGPNSNNGKGLPESKQIENQNTPTNIGK